MGVGWTYSSSHPCSLLPRCEFCFVGMSMEICRCMILPIPFRVQQVSRPRSHQPTERLSPSAPFLFPSPYLLEARWQPLQRWRTRAARIRRCTLLLYVRQAKTRDEFVRRAHTNVQVTGRRIFGRPCNRYCIKSAGS